MSDDNDLDGDAPGKELAAGMVKKLGALNKKLDGLTPMLADFASSAEELCSYFECFTRSMAVLADRKRGSVTKKISFNDFVEAWEIAADETWSDDGDTDDPDDPDDPDDGDDDPPVREPEPVGGGSRRLG